MITYINTGLSEKEAEKRLKKYGYNELKEKKITAIKILLRQFSNFIIYVLLAAAIISLLIKEHHSFFVILAIIGIVIFLGFIQEYKAEKAMQALKEIIVPMTTVLRDGEIKKIPTRNIVPGDILILEAGDKVPADAKILEAFSLKVDESILTGESIPVEKSKGDLIFSGTTVVHGKCKALVKATGMQTKIGKIAQLIQEIEEKTPLQIKIEELAKNLATIALIACVIVFLIGILKGAPIGEMLVIALALAVASVSEGLPLTLTLTLAFGMHKMAKHNAIVRKMLGIEALGSVTVICTDKTGTLTKNEMTVEKIFVNDKIITVTGCGYELKGEFFINGKKINVTKQKDLIMLIKACVLCNNAVLKENKTIGDPTEIALLVLGEKANLSKKELEKEYKRIDEIVFTPERKLMTTVHKKGNKIVIFSKGAPEVILEKCKYIQKNGKIFKLTKKEKEKILNLNKNFARTGLRVLGVAYKFAKKIEKENYEKNLIFLGLVGMIDPPREEVKQAIEACKKAGIKVIIVTGDHPETAKAIAEKIGLNVKNGIITGEKLKKLSEKELENMIENIVIFARIMPEQKLKIVKILKNKGHIVAMTGDGVNDAPALKKADVGIAMGIKGTDVAKESADIILQDDNFATIVEAIRQGRTIYDNIEKFTCYLISRNFTELILIFLAIILLGFEFLPLLAIHILFINTFDEILPSLSLGLDPPQSHVLLKKPRNPKEKILNKRNLIFTLSVATFIALASFFVFLSSIDNIEKARTLTFATIVSTILFLPFGFRSLEDSILKIDIFTNKLMIIGVICTFLITLSIMYIPFFQNIFELVPLSLKDWSIALSVAFSSLIFVEVIKAKIFKPWRS
ncbi:MAG TPA: calcium-translocating P-type ATPase, PMCA-type [Nanoarchaeota archaeon]|nr:calcium-translocating P-type ATPase, PMCA-type [Nanoarchaeota archaeon]